MGAAVLKGFSPATRTVRVMAVVAVVLTVLVGLAGRSLPIVGNAIGGIAYTLLIALLVLLLRPEVRPIVAAVIGVGISVLVELLQLTPVPGVLTEAVPPLRWVLGSTFV